MIRIENPHNFKKESVESDIAILILQKDIRLSKCKIKAITLPKSTLGNRHDLGNYAGMHLQTPLGLPEFFPICQWNRFK